MLELNDITVYDRLITKGFTVGHFGTAGEGLLSRAIRVVLGSSYSHVGNCFFPLDMKHPWDFYYYEALAGEGFLGPRYGTELNKWVREDSRRGLTVLDYHEITQIVGAIILGKTLAYQEVVTYGEFQLFTFFLFKRYGISMKKTKRTVICSEMSSRTFTPAFDIPAAVKAPSFDAVSPEDVMLWGKRQSPKVRFTNIIGGDK